MGVGSRRVSCVFSLSQESSDSREDVKPLDPGQTPSLAGNLSVVLTGAWTKQFSPDTSGSMHEKGETFRMCLSEIRMSCSLMSRRGVSSFLAGQQVGPSG